MPTKRWELVLSSLNLSWMYKFSWSGGHYQSWDKRMLEKYLCIRDSWETGETQACLWDDERSSYCPLRQPDPETGYLTDRQLAADAGMTPAESGRRTG